MLLLAAPVMLVAAVAVRLSSRGPVFFRQTRIGVGGREFTMIKFRSMVVDAEAPPRPSSTTGTRPTALLFKIRDDPRVTRVGALAAPLLPGRAAAADQRAPRRRCPWSGRARRCPRRSPATTGRRPPPAAGPARADRAVADQRPQRPVLGGVRAARPAVRRQLVARARPVDPLEDRGGGRCAAAAPTEPARPLDPRAGARLDDAGPAAVAPARHAACPAVATDAYLCDQASRRRPPPNGER